MRVRRLNVFHLTSIDYHQDEDKDGPSDVWKP